MKKIFKTKKEYDDALKARAKALKEEEFKPRKATKEELEMLKKEGLI